MKTLLVTANDTDAGKTWVTAVLAQQLIAAGAESVQIVKPVECGVPAGEAGDAAWAATQCASDRVTHHTLFSLPEPLAPLQTTGGDQLNLDTIAATIDTLPPAEWRILEGAGGISVPLDKAGADWTDLAQMLSIDAVIAVVENRLGAINQSRLLAHYLAAKKLHFSLWLNEVTPQSAAVKNANRDAIEQLKLPLCAITHHQQSEPEIFNSFWQQPTVSKTESPSPNQQYLGKLTERAQAGLERSVKPRASNSEKALLNLADNDYLRLSQHPEVISAAQEATAEWGTSSSASPLITGYTTLHHALEEKLCQWHGFPHGLLWNSGYAANQAILSLLPQKKDLILADRLIHNSMVSGILRSGAQLIRYPHCDLDRLTTLLEKHAHSSRRIFVVTESVFSMDGDYPDLKRIAELKARYPFFWILDEAHAVGWYGTKGAGLAEAANVVPQVDLLVGTLGKALGSSGAYTLFQEESIRRYLVNFAGEFIYSTFFPPASAAAALKAISLCESMHDQRVQWQKQATAFRQTLAAQNWETLGSDSPIVPVLLPSATQAVTFSNALLKQGIQACAIRPPTVPPNTSRVRFSLNSTLSDEHFSHITSVLKQARQSS